MRTTILQTKPDVVLCRINCPGLMHRCRYSGFFFSQGSLPLNLPVNWPRRGTVKNARIQYTTICRKQFLCVTTAHMCFGQTLITDYINSLVKRSLVACAQSQSRGPFALIWCCSLVRPVIHWNVRWYSALLDHQKDYFAKKFISNVERGTEGIFVASFRVWI